MPSRFGCPALRRVAPVGAGRLVIVLAIAIACSAPFFAAAHEEHDQASPGTVSPRPRVTAQSELYELVGILSGEQLAITLDHFDSNEPVVAATVAVSIGDGDPVAAAPQIDGTYMVSSPRLSGSGPVSLVFSVTAEPGDDLLKGTLQ